MIAFSIFFLLSVLLNLYYGDYGNGIFAFGISSGLMAIRSIWIRYKEESKSLSNSAAIYVFLTISVLSFYGTTLFPDAEPTVREAVDAATDKLLEIGIHMGLPAFFTLIVYLISWHSPRRRTQLAQRRHYDGHPGHRGKQDRPALH